MEDIRILLDRGPYCLRLIHRTWPRGRSPPPSRGQSPHPPHSRSPPPSRSRSAVAGLLRPKPVPLCWLCSRSFLCNLGQPCTCPPLSPLSSCNDGLTSILIEVLRF
ncbi:hypothetical protein PVAP13_1KG161315 [Panicum virgatum]|uniref:Uncharacterized protein n=1 Tax=Panicum virgatum TaxID=38727 RepID=A0A8T0WVB0_PANVG|nr:hypothetical protein PVAP13_1NG120500 [Panicum virgatum]KAG2649608.1 hypothetical protein PVAP13_1NG120500 [Panicum virgatum]KAG2649609.1 hypothetical protein PVAP13_1NG120500 [Panicum virgatum]KAG2657926.1 hypothetical protein PVAP13_1KG161315 [Panicum virgatum]